MPDSARPVELPELLAHASFLRGLARSLVEDAHRAEDLSQEAWLQALLSPPRHGANPRGWLAKVVRRAAGSERRKRANRAAREREWAPGEALPPAEETVATREVLARVTAAVLALEEPYQSTILLRFYEGLSPRDIAERAEVSLATVRSRQQRALHKLRERLADGDERRTRAWCAPLAALLTRRELREIVGTTPQELRPTARGATSASRLPLAGVLLLSSLAGAALWASANLGGADETPLVALPTPGVVAQAAPAELDVAAARASATREALPTPPPSPDLERGAIDVRVTWARDGSAARDLEVLGLAWEHASGDRRFEGRTDSSGRYRRGGLLPGRVVVDTSFGAARTVDVVAGETVEVELVLPVGLHVRGRVVDEQGHGVPGARLWLSAYVNDSKGCVVAVSGRDGLYELRDLPEARHLGAVADGYAPSELHALDGLGAVDAGAEPVELDLGLRPGGGDLTLRVVGAGGAPLAGALVRVEGSLIGYRANDGIPPLITLRTASFEGRTDALGVLVLRGIEPGPTELSAFAPGRAVWSGTAEVVGGEVRTVDVRMHAECVVRGTVRLPDGTPAADAIVAMQARYDEMRPMNRTDAQGHFEVGGLPAGHVTMKASVTGVGDATATFELTPGRPVPWDPRLTADRVVRGRVIDASRAPLAGWNVQVSASDPPGWRKSARSDEEGLFTIPACPRGHLTVRLHRSRDHMVTRTVFLRPDEDELEIVIRPEVLCDSSLRGQLLDADGEPLAGAKIAPFPSGANLAPTLTTDREGRFQIERIQSGEYVLHVTPEARPRFSLPEITIGVAESRDLGVLVLEPTERLSVIVEGEPGSTPYGYFHLDQLGTYGETIYAGVASVDPVRMSEGIELFPGTYRMRAIAGDGFASEERVVELAPGGGAHELRLSPRPGRACTLVVTVPQDVELPPRMTLSCSDSTGVTLYAGKALPTPDRSFRLWVRLGPGTYTLDASTPDGRSAQRNFEVELPAFGAPDEWPDLEVVLPLDR